MTFVRATAPGKLFLLGEYAALEGAPALIAAVSQRAIVTAAEAEAWQLTATGITVGTVELGPHGALPRALPEEVSRQLTLFDEVRKEVDGHFGGSGAPLRIVADSAAFQHGGNKLGLGSSAAIAVALAATLSKARGHDAEPDTVFRIADAAHRTAQGGTGSGGDIAASVHGGVILYRRDREREVVALPSALTVFAVATGTGSSTTELIGRVAQYQQNEPSSYRRDMESLVQLSESIKDALSTADGTLSLADRYFHAVATLAENSGAPIVTERHLEFRRLAAASGAVFKPSGAGGGDLGLVFGKLESVDALQSTFTEAGALVIPVPTRSDGVRVEPE